MLIVVVKKSTWFYYMYPGVLVYLGRKKRVPVLEEVLSFQIQAYSPCPYSPK